MKKITRNIALLMLAGGLAACSGKKTEPVDNGLDTVSLDEDIEKYGDIGGKEDISKLDPKDEQPNQEYLEGEDSDHPAYMAGYDKGHSDGLEAINLDMKKKENYNDKSADYTGNEEKLYKDGYKTGYADAISDAVAEAE